MGSASLMRCLKLRTTDPQKVRRAADCRNFSTSLGRYDAYGFIGLGAMGKCSEQLNS